ncbi:hypothetical protein NDJ87_10015 [Pseudomonas marginalis]|nr:hypothetical protein [Pseudomonas marginalis]MCM2377259.1 hypothetical protein [Pseudomonas marginalis]
MLDRLRQEPQIPTASTSHDRAQTEREISDNIEDNEEKILDC